MGDSRLSKSMDPKTRDRIQLNCLYEMFHGRVEENVIYIIYSENEGKIDLTIDQLMSIAASSFTGHYFGTSKSDQNEMALGTKDSTRSMIDSNMNQAKREQDTRKRSSSDSLKDEEDEEDEENDEESSLSIDERIERLKKSIFALLEEKKASHDKASQYSTKKMFPVTSYYSDLASQLRRMIELKTNQLVELLLAKSSDSAQIDLHGLNPIQAQLVVSELLRTRTDGLVLDKRGVATVDIITGWGKHSVTPNGQRVKPTIVKFLRDKGYEYEQLNKGALRVTLRR